MEQSAFEAVIIGVNVFVFIIALSAGVLLATNLLDMVDYANQNAIVGMNGSLAQSIGVVHERTYTGDQLLAYYRRVRDEYNESKYDFKIKSSELETEQSLQSYVESKSIYNYIDVKFELKYKGLIGNKETYVFVKI